MGCARSQHTGRGARACRRHQTRRWTLHGASARATRCSCSLRPTLVLRAAAQGNEGAPLGVCERWGSAARAPSQKSRVESYFRSRAITSLATTLLFQI